ncbi:ABC transporter ATP-binding protein [Carboxylicivirga marina]|uniref:ABC transporter ATP-binding protein n=1 Tax=Carboxylicivirga marina TaxID=2800988 RepID=UPI0025944A61|nr:ABC transporter ATP-binding protein [uncultured Carboxylicivirga sp.]
MMILKGQNIRKAFGHRTVLKGIDIAIDAGCVKGVVGENGSGKSTLVKILVGFVKADAGQLRVKGKIGYCPQEPLVFSRLSVAENFKYYASAYDLQAYDKEQSRYYKYLMEFFRFGQYKNDKVLHLSGGTVQKLNLAIALMHRPDLLILDEPYNGFDWETYQAFLEFIDVYRKQGGSVLLVTHLLTDNSYFDEVYKLNNGVLE